MRGDLAAIYVQWASQWGWQSSNCGALGEELITEAIRVHKRDPKADPEALAKLVLRDMISRSKVWLVFLDRSRRNGYIEEVVLGNGWTLTGDYPGYEFVGEFTSRHLAEKKLHDLNASQGQLSPLDWTTARCYPPDRKHRRIRIERLCSNNVDWSEVVYKRWMGPQLVEALLAGYVVRVRSIDPCYLVIDHDNDRHRIRLWRPEGVFRSGGILWHRDPVCNLKHLPKS